MQAEALEGAVPQIDEWDPRLDAHAPQAPAPEVGRCVDQPGRRLMDVVEDRLEERHRARVAGVQVRSAAEGREPGVSSARGVELQDTVARREDTIEEPSRLEVGEAQAPQINCVGGGNRAGGGRPASARGHAASASAVSLPAFAACERAATAALS
jgi:hypothetical protein